VRRGGANVGRLPQAAVDAASKGDARRSHGERVN
jgi:hypothetical protein